MGAGAARRDKRQAQTTAPPPPALSGGCCTGTRQRRQSDLVGVHADFGRPARVGRGPPPLSGGCCTSTRVLRPDDMKGAHEDFVCTRMAPISKQTNTSGLLREEPGARALTSSPAPALPWRPSRSSPANVGDHSHSTGDTRLVPRYKSLSPATLPAELESEPASEQVLRLELPWRRQRAFNWEGSWREDRAQQIGMTELFEALEYPWHIRQIMKAAPGPTWVIKCVKKRLVLIVACILYTTSVACRGLHISEPCLRDRNMTDEGHTLMFDTNSKVGFHTRQRTTFSAVT